MPRKVATTVSDKEFTDFKFWAASEEGALSPGPAVRRFIQEKSVLGASLREKLKKQVKGKK